MAAGLSAAVTPKPFRSLLSSHHRPNPTPVFSPLLHHQRIAHGARRKTSSLSVSFVLGEQKHSEPQIVNREEERSVDVGNPNIDPRILIPAHVAEKLARKRSERFTYLVAAGGEVPISEMLGTFALSVGAAVGMEFWARWAHQALWHASLWHMHESHHRPREGAFELNDVFAIINAVPAIGLLSYGFFNKGLAPGLCFGAGLGITVFGMAYMFVHDGLVHKRFQVGPIANVPYFRKVAAAHQLHHSEKFQGVPYGLFLGPKELEEVGGLEELEKEINRRIKSSKTVHESQ
ncbi:Beta-carotene 3-hydroxylase 1 [Hibiscus syriacus]|uniref:beta-carotene 3-hydroxylase n=1 Tax=Hibiscus syriacus TaxID=106335 RepID=A0A6A3CZU6_HIBSY|nr:Beta-carotene 3-hydroxylase 1 [Hibiscus syriacus]